MKWTKGYTFTNGLVDDISAANLHTMVDSATPSEMVLTDFKSDQAPPITQTGTPSISGLDNGNYWSDESFGNGTVPVHLLKYRSGGSWLPESQARIMTNRDGTNMSKTDAVIISTSFANSFETPGTSDMRVLGILLEDINDTDDGLVNLRGGCLASVSSTTLGACLRTAGVNLTGTTITCVRGGCAHLISSADDFIFYQGVHKSV
jgi:hypothetical protein